MAIRETHTNDQHLTLIRALAYGESGIGKTTSLGTLPEETTAVIALERGLLPLRNKKFTVFSVETWDDIRDIGGTLRTPMIRNGKTIRTVAIDSLSEISELCKHQITQVDRRAMTLERTKGKTDRTTGIYDDLMGMEDWNVYTTRMRKLINFFCHLPVNVVFTSLEQWTEDKRRGGIYRTVNLNGKLANECPSFFDLVMHMEASADEDGNPIRVWRTYNDGICYAKDASGVLDPFEKTNWTDLFSKIMKNEKSEAAA